MKFSLLYHVASLTTKALRQPTLLYSSVYDGPKSPKEQIDDSISRAATSAIPIAALLGGFAAKSKAVVPPPLSPPLLLPGDLLLSPSELSEMRQTIAEGRIYVKDDFIPADLVHALRCDIQSLVEAGFFKPSGLTDSAKGEKQDFGQQDRSVCPVSFDDMKMPENVRLVGSKLVGLRNVLCDTLRRPSLSDNTLAHESYLSRSLPGASLKRHLDEKHEETKGRKGWSTMSRRSLTWLVYLSEPGWTVGVNGGGLRAFPQRRRVMGPPCGSDNGNLQVGWWRSSREREGDEKEVVEPVFLDSWINESPQVSTTVNNDPSGTFTVISGDVVARCALYIKEQQGGPFGTFRRRRYLTERFDMRDPVTGTMRDNFDDVFLPATRLMSSSLATDDTPTTTDTTTTSYVIDNNRKNNDDSSDTTSSSSSSPPPPPSTSSSYSRQYAAERFLLIEDISAWAEGKIPAGSEPLVVCPKGGTLVIFDSAA